METLTRRLLLLTVPIACLAAAPVIAEEDQPEPPDSDVTMSVMEEGDDPGVFFERIELPEVASATAVERSEHGQDTANLAREDGRAFGQSMAEEARERAGEAGGAAEDARSSARDNLTSDVASGVLDDLPEQARDNIPEDVQERVREARERRGPPDERGPGG